jgi:hypothetical protein
LQAALKHPTDFHRLRNIPKPSAELPATLPIGPSSVVVIDANRGMIGSGKSQRRIESWQESYKEKLRW